jgi:glycerate 2-kinase
MVPRKQIPGGNGGQAILRNPGRAAGLVKGKDLAILMNIRAYPREEKEVYVKNREEVIGHENSRGREMVLDIIEAGLAAVDPYLSTGKLARIEKGKLIIGGHPEMDLSGYGDEVIDLNRVKNIYVIGAGKTVQKQAQALEDVLGSRLTAGAMTIKKGEEVILRKIEVTEGAHPVPDEKSVEGTRRIVEIARKAGEGDLVLALFSSGSSSLLALPSDGYSLEDMRAVYKLAIQYGDQSLIWRVMKYFSAVNSGRIVMMIHPARTVNLLMSIKGYEPWRGKIPLGGDWIPSWPPGPRRLANAVREMKTEPWWQELPGSMRAALERRDPECELPNIEDFRRVKASYWQPIDHRRMLEAAGAKAEEHGFRGVILGTWMMVQSTDTAEIMIGMARDCLRYGTPFKPPLALLSAGEMTVPVGNATGIGGRNQEFSLAAAVRISDPFLSGITVGSVDTDGTDGPGIQMVSSGDSDFRTLAGGVVDGQTLAAARAMGIDLLAELKNHNSTPVSMKLKSGIYTGNTGIVGGDLRVALIPNPKIQIPNKFQSPFQ